MDASCRTSVLNSHFLCFCTIVTRMCFREAKKTPTEMLELAPIPRSMEMLILNKDR